jgi:hypothetical protein
VRRALFVFACAVLFSERSPANAIAKPPVPSLMTGTSRTLGDGWTRTWVELEASQVDLGHTGQHTHANWVVFQLPFDPASPEVRNVTFLPRAVADTDVAMLQTPFGCVPAPTLGPVDDGRWSKYTSSGVAGTTPFSWHELVPTHDARAYAINVPTRVANAAACRDPSLYERTTWRLVVEWDVRAPDFTAPSAGRRRPPPPPSP